MSVFQLIKKVFYQHSHMSKKHFFHSLIDHTSQLKMYCSEYTEFEIVDIKQINWQVT